MTGGPSTEGRQTADPWQQWLHNLRNGYVHPTGGGQQGQPAESQSHGEKNCDQDYEGVNKKSAFSEKVAMAPENRYDGERKGAQWRLNVRPYLISRAPSIAHVLHYVEEHEDQSGLVDDILPYAGLPKSILMQLALDLWGFLTLNLQGTAKIWVNNSKMMEGFELWRKAMKSVRSRSVAAAPALVTLAAAASSESRPGSSLLLPTSALLSRSTDGAPPAAVGLAVTWLARMSCFDGGAGARVEPSRADQGA